MGLVSSAKCCYRRSPCRQRTLAYRPTPCPSWTPHHRLPPCYTPPPCRAPRPITHSYVSCGCECFNCTRATATPLAPTLPRRAVALLYNCELRGHKHSTKQAHFAKKRGLRSLDAIAATALPRRHLATNAEPYTAFSLRLS